MKEKGKNKLKLVSLLGTYDLDAALQMDREEREIFNKLYYSEEWEKMVEEVKNMWSWKELEFDKEKRLILKVALFEEAVEKIEKKLKELEKKYSNWKLIEEKSDGVISDDEIDHQIFIIQNPETGEKIKITTYIGWDNLSRLLFNVPVGRVWIEKEENGEWEEIEEYKTK